MKDNRHGREEEEVTMVTGTRGRTFGSDGSIADVFTSQVLLNRIENASELFIESTVQGVLKRPKSISGPKKKYFLRHGAEQVKLFYQSISLH
ncbi:hypothetical protein KQX54_000495 [Cotesia glomerata]|uniref:Uncharacterized protein n=1 Tax=Cotesia glomerata TaxID=32391 RepID=A0AAV7HUA0_COTGL|nr:hypothetical protein KQX54_000495 [Cotesia glomerata]